MATKKLKILHRVSDVSAKKQMCWGVECDVFEEKKDNFILVAELPEKEADAMIKASRAKEVKVEEATVEKTTKDK